jgi:hypothetical protein
MAATPPGTRRTRRAIAVAAAIAGAVVLSGAPVAFASPDASGRAIAGGPAVQVLAADVDDFEFARFDAVY